MAGMSPVKTLCQIAAWALSSRWVSMVRIASTSSMMIRLVARTYAACAPLGVL